MTRRMMRDGILYDSPGGAALLAAGSGVPGADASSERADGLGKSPCAAGSSVAAAAAHPEDTRDCYPCRHLWSAFLPGQVGHCVIFVCWWQLVLDEDARWLCVDPAVVSRTHAVMP
jgi:hypothetical protein